MRFLVYLSEVFDYLFAKTADFGKNIYQSKIGMTRFVVQLFSLIVLLGGAFGIARTWLPLPITFPIGNPFGIVWDGFEALQYTLLLGIIPFFIIGIFLLFSIVLGRTTCGWVCPFGFFQDLLSKLPISKVRLGKDDNSFLNGLKYALLVIFVSVAALIGVFRDEANTDLTGGFRTISAYSLFDPSGTLFATFYYYFRWDTYSASDNLFDAVGDLGFFTIVRVILFFVISVASLKIPRFYCRFMCPTGALLAITSDRSIFGIKKDADKCPDDCSKCEQACPMQVSIVNSITDTIRDRSCINCGVCIDACPSGGISYTLRIGV